MCSACAAQAECRFCRQSLKFGVVDGCGGPESWASSWQYSYGIGATPECILRVVMCRPSAKV